MHPRKFKVDENLPVEVAEILRGAGHDALTIGDQAMSGQPDASVADVCRREGRLRRSEGAIKVAVHRLRHRYRELMLARIAETVDEGEVEDELRNLLGAGRVLK